MIRFLRGRITAASFAVILLIQSFTFLAPADATSLLIVLAAQSQAQRNAAPAPQPTPPPPPPNPFSPPIDITPLGPLPPDIGLPFGCEYIDLGADSGGVVFDVPECTWLDVGVGATFPDDGSMSLCVCARVDVIDLLGGLFKP